MKTETPEQMKLPELGSLAVLVLKTAAKVGLCCSTGLEKNVHFLPQLDMDTGVRVFLAPVCVPNERVADCLLGFFEEWTNRLYTAATTHSDLSSSQD
jgi:hypothetical protein